MQNLGIKAIIRRKYVHRTSYEAAVSDGKIAGITRLSGSISADVMTIPLVLETFKRPLKRIKT